MPRLPQTRHVTHTYTRTHAHAHSGAQIARMHRPSHNAHAKQHNTTRRHQKDEIDALNAKVLELADATAVGEALRKMLEEGEEQRARLREEAEVSMSTVGSLLAGYFLVFCFGLHTVGLIMPRSSLALGWPPNEILASSWASF